MQASHELIVDARGIHAWYGSSHVLRGVDLRIGRGQTALGDPIQVRDSAPR